MGVEFRRVVSEHIATRAAIQSQTGDIATLITASESNIISDNASQTSTLQAQLNAIESAVGALQTDVSAAISAPTVLERPDRGFNRIIRIYYYNFNNSKMEDVHFGNPTITISNSSGTPITNGSTGTGGAVAISAISLLRQSVGVYYFDLDFDYPALGTPNMDLGNYHLEITVQESSVPEYSKHPRSFEVVELSGIESGFASLASGQTSIQTDILNSRNSVETLIGSPTGDLSAMLTALQTDVTNLSTSLSSNHGITELLNSVEIIPWGADPSTQLLTADPTEIIGDQYSSSSTSATSFSSFFISIPTASSVSLQLKDNVVEYDIAWKSKMLAGTGLSQWAISASNIAQGVAMSSGSPVYITDAVSADSIETKHARQGEVKHSIHNATSGWYLILSGRSTSGDQLTLKTLAETRIKFSYSVSSV